MSHCPGSHFIEGKASLALSKVGWDKKKKVGTSEPPTPQLGQNTKFFFLKKCQIESSPYTSQVPQLPRMSVGFPIPLKQDNFTSEK